MADGHVFIVGMNGSGTTMLANRPGRHPALYMFRLEARVLPYFLHRVDRYGDLNRLDARRRLADDIGAAKPFWQVNGRQAPLLPDSRLTEPGYAGEVNGIFAELAEREGKGRRGEKSVMNLGHLAALAAQFPSAKFVHIIRDGPKAAQSFHWRHRYEPLHTLYRWRNLVTLGCEQGRAIAHRRYFEVHCEALTKQPENEMRRHCDLLGLPFSPCVTELSIRMIDQVAAEGQSGIIDNSGSGDATLTLRNASKWSASRVARLLSSAMRSATRQGRRPWLHGGCACGGTATGWPAAQRSSSNVGGGACPHSSVSCGPPSNRAVCARSEP